MREWFDLPGRAGFKVAWQSCDRRGLPSPKEGKKHNI